MAQVHVGTSSDQPVRRISTRGAPMFSKALAQLEQIGVGSPTEEDGSVVLPPNLIDLLQMALSAAERIDTPVKKTLRALLPLASPQQPLVLIGYSRGSVEVASAVQEYIAEAEKRGQADVRSRLRETVTVVTIGTPQPAIQDEPAFQDGPAYVHVSSTTDWATKISRVNSDHPDLAGEGATFIHCNTPYPPNDFNNHNFASSVCQYLFLLMHTNKVKSFRDLHERGAKGELADPENVDEITNALIRVTGGLDYLWHEKGAEGEVPLSIPEMDAAVAILQRRLGQDVADRLVSKFRG